MEISEGNNVVRVVPSNALGALTPDYWDLIMLFRAPSLLEAIHFCVDHRLVLLGVHASGFLVAKHLARAVSADAAATLPWSQLEECVPADVCRFVTSAFALWPVFPAGTLDALAFTSVRQHSRLLIWA